MGKLKDSSSTLNKNKTAKIHLTYRNYRTLSDIASDLIKIDPNPSEKTGKRLKCIVDLVMQYEKQMFKF